MVLNIFNKNFFFNFILNKHVSIQNQNYNAMFKQTVKNSYYNNYNNVKKIIKKNKIKKIYKVNFYKSYQTSLFAQKLILFYKRKFGLFKTSDFTSKKLKQQLVRINFILKGKKDLHKKNINFKRKPRIFFYKKFNKLFFRDGRSIIMKYLPLKKYMIQKYTTKKIYNIVKNPFPLLLYETKLVSILVQSGISYTFSDSKKFIQTFGIKINNVLSYEPEKVIEVGKPFELVSSIFIYRYMRKKRYKVISSLSKIKFYKFRSKLYFSKNFYEWKPTRQWLLEHIILYSSKRFCIEFDLKVLKGVLLLRQNARNLTNAVDTLDFSYYMARSYTWKYLT